MPIKGLTDQYRIPRCGKIHLGEEFVGTGKSHPKATPFFRVPDEVAAVYGREPTTLEVIFPYADPEKNCDVWYKRYVSGGVLRCKGDGERATELTEQGRMNEIECLGEDCPAFQSRKCRRVAMLSLILPKVPGIGVWQITTSSIHSVRSILGVQALLNNLGRNIAGTTFKLHRVLKEVAPDGKAKKVYVLRLECPLTWEQIMSEQPRRLGFTDKEVEPATDAMPGDLYPKDVGEAASKKEAMMQELAQEMLEDPTITALMNALDLKMPQREALAREYTGDLPGLIADLSRRVTAKAERESAGMVEKEPEFDPDDHPEVGPGEPPENDDEPIF